MPIGILKHFCFLCKKMFPKRLKKNPHKNTNVRLSKTLNSIAERDLETRDINKSWMK